MPIKFSVYFEQNMTEIASFRGIEKIISLSSCCKLLQEIDDLSVPVLEEALFLIGVKFTVGYT